MKEEQRKQLGLNQPASSSPVPINKSVASSYIQRKSIHYKVEDDLWRQRQEQLRQRELQMEEETER